MPNLKEMPQAELNQRLADNRAAIVAAQDERRELKNEAHYRSSAMSLQKKVAKFSPTEKAILRAGGERPA